MMQDSRGRVGDMRPDTRAILRVAGFIEVAGLLCAVAVWTSGGMTTHGPHGNIGWLGLIVALGCIPTGTFFLILGLAKWMGDRKRTDAA